MYLRTILYSTPLHGRADGVENHKMCANCFRLSIRGSQTFEPTSVFSSWADTRYDDDEQIVRTKTNAMQQELIDFRVSLAQFYMF